MPRPMFRPFPFPAAAAVLALLLPLVAQAQAPRPTDAILDALRLDELLDVLRHEAVETGRDLAADMTGAQTADDWSRVLSRINDPDRLAPVMRDSFAAAFDDDMAAPVLDFLTSQKGQTVIGLELSARQALLDPAIERMSQEALARSEDAGAPRLDLIMEFVEVNDLIDINVAGAMNANAAFLRGLRAGAGGATAGAGLSDSDILAQVWSQEPELRTSTVSWLRSFLLLAYQPLSDADLQAYIAFSDSPAGQALNTALFAGFDAVFVQTSRETGEALAQIMSSEDL